MENRAPRAASQRVGARSVISVVGAADDDDDDNRGTNAETARLISEENRGQEPVADKGAEDAEDSTQGTRSCTTAMANACSASAHAVWSYATFPLIFLVSRLWATANASSDSGAAVHSPRAVTCSNGGDEGNASTGSSIPRAAAGRGSRSVDGHGSPLYTSFHPGDGYETLDPHPSAVVPPNTDNDTRHPSLIRRSPQPSRGKRESPRRQLPATQVGGTASSSTMCSSNSGEGSGPAYASVAQRFAAPMDAIATAVERGPIYTIHELQRRVNAIVPWLPLSVTFSVGDQSKYSVLPVEWTTTPVASSPSASATAEAALSPTKSTSVVSPVLTTTTESSTDVIVPLHVVLCGPIRRPLCAPALDCDDGTFDLLPTLSDVEDLILEDTVGLPLHALSLVDLSFLATDYEPLPEGNSDLVAAIRSSSARSYHRAAGDTVVIDAKATTSATPLVVGTSSSMTTEPLPLDPPEEPFDVVRARILGMIQNLVSSVVVERRGRPFLLKLSFVRCRFTPGDLLDALRLPGAFLETLAFVQCPLADAHVAALLRRARQDESFFAHMRSLTLSGTLSGDSVRCVLRFLDEEVENPALCELNVPPLCVAAASGHPISVRLPNLLVNGKRIATIRQV